MALFWRPLALILLSSYCPTRRLVATYSFVILPMLATGEEVSVKFSPST